MAIRSIIASEQIEHRIYSFRGTKVMLDADLALLYGVETRALVQAVKRNAARFPEDFMFQLSKEEFEDLRSQSVISSWGGRRYTPYAFTEQGVAMLSALLQSPRAVAVSIEIMRVFVRLRKMLASHDRLSRKLAELETRMTDHDEKFGAVFDAIRQLLEEDASRKRKPAIGYHTEAARSGRKRRNSR